MLTLTRGSASRLGYKLVRDTIYSPIPDLPDPESFDWDRQSDLAGVEWNIHAQTSFLHDHIAPFLGEFFPPGTRSTDIWHHYVANGYYQTGDAEVLYGMIRHLKPRRIIEVGSGFSTMITAMACGANRDDGYPAAFASFDPVPRTAPTAELSGLVMQERVRAQEIPLARFLELECDDVLFVDSSHTVKRASDVNYLVLEVLPRLRTGVVVHFHDVFLPWDYPRQWFEHGTYLTEQYLLQAFLSGSRHYDVVLSMYALSRQHPEELRKLIPDYRPYYFGPSALWLRRLPPDAPR